MRHPFDIQFFGGGGGWLSFEPWLSTPANRSGGNAGDILNRFTDAVTGGGQGIKLGGGNAENSNTQSGQPQYRNRGGNAFIPPGGRTSYNYDTPASGLLPALWENQRGNRNYERITGQGK